MSDYETTVSRADHLQWAKNRALQYVDRGDLQNAFASFCSDLGKHPKTADHLVLGLGIGLLLNGHLGTPQKMREFIEGTN